MPHNVNRKPVYPDRSKPPKRKPRVNFKKIGIGILKWTPLWIPMVIWLWFLIPDIVDNNRLKHNGIRTAARVEKTYLVTGGAQCFKNGQILLLCRRLALLWPHIAPELSVGTVTASRPI